MAPDLSLVPTFHTIEDDGLSMGTTPMSDIPTFKE
jgi:hypothetical protein